MHDFCEYLAVFGQLLVDVNCTTDVEEKTHTINVQWQVDPNLNLTNDIILNESAKFDFSTLVECMSTNTSISVSGMFSIIT